MNVIQITGDSDITLLRAGDAVEFSGTAYTARDAAHKRFVEAANSCRPLPIDIKGAAIYYAGPTPARQGEIIGSCGPTTSARMDSARTSVCTWEVNTVKSKTISRRVFCAMPSTLRR